MTNKEKQKSKNTKEENNSSSDDENTTISNIKDILLDIVEDPNTIIEKILIKIFNKIIINRNDIEENFILFHTKKVKDLCQKHLKKNIILLLFLNLRSIIQKYRRKLFEIPSIIELRKNYFQKYEFRSYSYKEKYSKRYLNFAIDRIPSVCRKSPEKGKYFDYYLVVKNLFNKLLGIKNCLRKASPIIEKIFEYPLSEFEAFSIFDCAKEDFLKILIHDDFIWNEIVKNKKSQLTGLIQEILEDLEEDSFHVNVSENKIDYYKNFTRKTLKFGKVKSSSDSRTPEDASVIRNLLEDEEEKIINNESDFEVEKSIGDNFDIKNNNNFSNINMIRFNSKELIKNNFDIKKAIITSETINEINNLNDSLNIEKNFSFNGSKIKIHSHSHINMNNISNISSNNKQDNDFNNNKFSKKRFHKKIENNNVKNKNKNEDKKISEQNEEKKEIPNDLDDLVKYIKNDSANKNKKKKKNRKKTKKRNKNGNNDNKDDKKEQNEIEVDNNVEEDDTEIQLIKDDLVKNSINRYKIHKIKFKYKPKYINKISKI